MGLVGFGAIVALVAFGPVELDFWTELGLILAGAGVTLR
ncbi:hypothetical protein SEA_SNEK_31 [Arthrobacter phage Snek]|uniref:Uncharacterized protein n=1 Tax=Arthrobacter phage Tweety19 TaxID=2768133 RepID=A0A7G9W229_9CAUD|nr:hypothetical protein PQE19_gp31 [Arthrobacter phage Tweety19]QNO12692.1 hypothetical protein SEA_TWEETY19_31 [Arthrobacter phage Tweety19]